MEPFRTGGARPPFRTSISRGLRLRCGCCGRGRVYRSAWRMNHDCPVCGIPYYREPGYFVGAMIVNYVVTIFVVITAYLISRLIPPFWSAPPETKITVWLIASVCLSLILVPWTRSLWIAVDYWIEPWSPNETR